MTKADLDHPTSKTKETIDLKSNSRKSEFVAEEKTEFKKPNKSRQDKIKRRVQNFKKIGEKVAATTIGDYLVNPDLWTIYSLSNRLFDNKTTC